FAQHLHPIRRRPGGSEYRPAQRAVGENHACQAPTILGRLITVHDLIQRLYIGQSRIAFPPGLIDVANEALLFPCYIRLAREKRFDRKGPALYLAALNAEIELRPAGVTQHGVDLEG